MQSAIDFGMQVLFSIWGYDVTLFEFLASSISLAGVSWAITGKRSTWPLWVISSALYGVLFWQWDLKASALLQIVFIVAGVMGWFGWGPQGAVPAKLTRRELVLWSAGLLTMWIALHPVFEAWGAAAAWSDTFMLVGSIVAQIIMVLQKYENWPLWFAVDLVGTIQYAYMNLWFTALLYGLFVAIAVVGWRAWFVRADEPEIDGDLAAATA